LKPSIECAECSKKVFLRVLENTDADEKTKTIAMTKALSALAEEMRKGTAPVDFSNRIFSMLYETTGTLDPFADVKRLSNKVAMSLLPRAWEEVRTSEEDERLRKAALIAIAGNELDVSTGSHTFSLDNLWGRIEATLQQGLQIDHSGLLSGPLSDPTSIFMVGDNAGEIVLDIPLIRVIRQTGARVYYVVRGGPIANDATIKDVAEVGLQREVDAVATTGKRAFGLSLNDLPSEAKELLAESSIVIAKGQSNYESLNWAEVGVPVCFLFKVKCAPIGRTISMPVGSNVLMLKEWDKSRHGCQRRGTLATGS